MQQFYVCMNSKHTHTRAELQALAEIIGPYGIRFMGEKLMEQVSGQVTCSGPSSLCYMCSYNHYTT